MKFNKNEFNAFRADVESALRCVEEKYQVAIKATDVTFSEFDFSLKLNCVRTDIDGSKATFDKNCWLYGFSAEDYRREFVLDGALYRLEGFNLNARKNTCRIVRVKDGKEFIASHIVVKKAFGSNKKEA